MHLPAVALEILMVPPSPFCIPSDFFLQKKQLTPTSLEQDIEAFG